MNSAFFLGTTLGIVIVVIGAIWALLVALLPIAAWKATSALDGIHQAILEANKSAERAHDGIVLLSARLDDAPWPVSPGYAALHKRLMAADLERADWELVNSYERHSFLIKWSLDHNPSYTAARKAAWSRINERNEQRRRAPNDDPA